MEITATFQDGKFVPDEPASFQDGDRLELRIERLASTSGAPRRGSPEAVLRLAGTLTDEEAEHFLRMSQECRRVDSDLWIDGP